MAMAAVPGLVTVTGEGGVGKTRLVLEVARRESRPVHVVPLADLDRTGATLAIRRECAPLLVSRFDAATGTLREAAPTAADAEPRLLVLDSVEQVGQISDLIAEIRGTVEHLTILVTSRSRLGLSHERVLHLSGLPTTADGPAVELFLARSVAVGADPQGLHTQLPAIASLCRALDGVPLAIELAAARTRMMSPTALLAQVHSPNHRRLLTLLAKGPADLPTRQLSMRATLSWSHQLLAPAHQVLFRRLGVLPGSFSLDAAEAIVTDDGVAQAGGSGPGDETEIVLDGIAEMVDLHLLEPVTSPNDPEPVRFAMSDVARAFAAELLAAAGEGPTVQARLTRWCLDLLGRAAQGIPSVEEEQWLNRVERELPAIRQSLVGCAADGDGPLGLALCLGLGEYWIRRGSPTEGIGWLRTFLDMVTDDQSDRAPAGQRPARIDAGLDRTRRLALGWWARLAVLTGDPGRLSAIRAARPAMIDRYCPATWLSWTDHLILGLLLAGEYEECGLLIADALGAAQEHDDSYWTCMFLMRRALLRWLVVRCTQDRLALQWARMAHVAAADCGLVRLAARAANLTALSLLAARDWTGADRLLTANLEGLHTSGDASGLALARNLLGLAMIELDRPVAAADHLIEAITQARRCDDRVAEVAAAWAVSFLACRVGRHADAALAVDAVAVNSRLLERAVPAPIVEDFRRARATNPDPDASPAGGTAIQGWGWLSGWAIGIATDISTDISTDIATSTPGPAAVDTGWSATARSATARSDTARSDTPGSGTAVPVAAVPLTAMPLTAVPLPTIPVAAVPLPTMPLTAVPLTTMPLTAVPLTTMPDTAVPAPAPIPANPGGAVPEAAVGATPRAEPGAIAGPATGGSASLIPAPARRRAPTEAPGPRPSEVLTARELEILAAIASGRTNAQIAGDFFLSTKTVMHHSGSIYRKLEVRGRAEAVALAYRTGLLRNQFG